jgi:hypothetical protein
MPAAIVRDTQRVVELLGRLRRAEERVRAATRPRRWTEHDWRIIFDDDRSSASPGSLLKQKMTEAKAARRESIRVEGQKKRLYTRNSVRKEVLPVSEEIIRDAEVYDIDATDLALFLKNWRDDLGQKAEVIVNRVAVRAEAELSRGGYMSTPKDRPIASEKSKYFVVKGTSTSLSDWGGILVPGMVISSNDIDRPGIEISNLIERGILRPAAAEEVKQFKKRYPISKTEERVQRTERRAYLEKLEERLANAKKLSAKAALCLELVKELRERQANLSHALMGESGGRVGHSEEETRAYHVQIHRRVQVLKVVYKAIKRAINKLAEPLMVAAEKLPDFPSTPLLYLLETWDMQFYLGTNPVFAGAEDFLKRLRLKLLSQEVENTPTAEGIWERAYAGFRRLGTRLYNVTDHNLIGGLILTAVIAGIGLVWAKAKGCSGIEGTGNAVNQQTSATLPVSPPKPPKFDPSAFSAVELSTTIDLTGWRSVSPQQMKARIKVSPSKERTVWKLRKTQVEAATFRVSVYTPGPAPEMIPDPRHRLIWTGKLYDDVQRGTDAFDRYEYHFDVSSEPVGEVFTIDYELIRWNTHQGKPDWWHGKVIEYPTEKLTFTFVFSKGRPSPSNALMLKDYQADEEMPLRLGKDYFVTRSDDGLIVTFSVPRPMYHFGYLYYYDWKDLGLQMPDANIEEWVSFPVSARVLEGIRQGQSPSYVRDVGWRLWNHYTSGRLKLPQRLIETAPNREVTKGYLFELYQDGKLTSLLPPGGIYGPFETDK